MNEEYKSFGQEAEWLPRLSLNAQIRSAHALITREIAMHIMRGDYPENSVLPNENVLIEQFRVSRTALREALKTLAAKGLIISKTKIGTKVLPSPFWNLFDPQLLTWRIDLGIDADFLIKLFEVRQAIEPAVAALSASRRTKENIDRMRQFLDSMNRPNHSRLSYAEPDLHFHQEVLMASGNAFFQSFSTIVEASILCAFQISAPIDSPERQELSIQRHRMVLDAIVAGDAGAASRAMSQVILEGIENAHFALAKSPIAVSLAMPIRAA